MPRRPQRTAADFARPIDTARQQNGDAPKASLPLGRPIHETDPALSACTNWLTRNAAHERLTRRWQDLETYLIRERDWFKLGKRARAGIPEAAEFEALNHRLVELQALNEDLLLALPAIAATTAQGLASKLAVAATHVRPDENAEAHHLLESILRDLQAIAGLETMPSTGESGGA